MRIGQLATQTGISVEALRYYEREGLLSAPQRSDSGYRHYPDSAIKQVNFILEAKALGFSLKGIAELLSLQVNRENSTCGDVKAIAEKKLVDIEAKIAHLQTLRDALQKVTQSCEGGDKPAQFCSILDAMDA